MGRGGETLTASALDKMLRRRATTFGQPTFVPSAMPISNRNGGRHGDTFVLLDVDHPADDARIIGWVVQRHEGEERPEGVPLYFHHMPATQGRGERGWGRTLQ